MVIKGRIVKVGKNCFFHGKFGGSEEGFEGLPDVVGNDAVAGGVGVDAVGLVEAGDAADVLEEEGDEREVVFGGEGGEDVAKGGGVGGAHRGGNLHAGENDAGGGVLGFYGVDDRLEVGGGAGDGDTAEAVVGAEFEDEDVHGLAEDPADATASAGGGFAGDAGVGDGIGYVEGVDAVFDEVGEALARGDAVAGGEAVAEEDEMFWDVRLKERYEQGEDERQFYQHSCKLGVWKAS